MFGRRFRIMRLMGVDIRLDITWVILFLLVTWSLSRGVFPVRYGQLRPEDYWWMGITAALGLFASLLLHELCHAAVARTYGIPIRGITLFIFGGVAEMDDEPKSAKAEFLMAGAGPLCSVLLGVVLALVASLGTQVRWPETVIGVLSYLAWINFLVAGFNLLPGFPLDGGRILRAALWQIKGDLRWATRIAAGLGTGLGILLNHRSQFRITHEQRRRGVCGARV
jgi:Zn-dependent protease